MASLNIVPNDHPSNQHKSNLDLNDKELCHAILVQGTNRMDLHSTFNGITCISGGVAININRFDVPKWSM
jgi:hypothetical protein